MSAEGQRKRRDWQTNHSQAFDRTPYVHISKQPIVSILSNMVLSKLPMWDILAKISSLTHRPPSSTYQRTYACIIYQSQPYNMNLNKIAPIASKIATNQQAWQDKYRITGRHKDLRGNPLWGKTTGGGEQAIHYEDKDTRGGSQQGWERLHIPSDFTL